MNTARLGLLALCLAAAAPGCIPATVAVVAATAATEALPHSSLFVNHSTVGHLSPWSPVVHIPGRTAGIHHSNVWTLHTSRVAPVTLLMCETPGSDFDPYLTVSLPWGYPLQDDDSAGGYHGHGSRVIVPPTPSGMPVTVYASSFRSVGNNDSGSYTLQVLPGAQPWARCP